MIKHDSKPKFRVKKVRSSEVLNRLNEKRLVQGLDKIKSSTSLFPSFKIIMGIVLVSTLVINWLPATADTGTGTATLFVTMTVNEQHGGTNTVADFPVNVTDSSGNFTMTANNTTSIDAGTYSVSVTPVAGYYYVYFGNCSNATAVVGSTVSCNIVIFDSPADINTAVIVNGGSAIPSDVTVSVSGSNANPATFSGDSNGTDAAVDTGSFSVSGSALTNYSETSTGSCSGTADIGDAFNCLLTYTYNPPVVNNNINLTVEGSGSGTVSSSPGSVLCVTGAGTGCSDAIASGTEVTLTATADASSTFAGFSGDCVSLSTTCTVTLSADANVTATFDLTSTSTPTPISTPTPTPIPIIIPVIPTPTPTPTPTSTGADLALTKTVDNSNPNVGDTVNYTLTINNLGPLDATNVVATDTLPSGLTFVSASTTLGTYDPSSGIWTVGTLANGSSTVLTVTASVNSGTAGSTVVNNAVVGDDNDPNLSNNTASATLTVNNGTGGGCASNCGGSVGAGSVSFGGGSAFPTPAPTPTPFPPSLAYSSLPQVLGASASDPNTVKSQDLSATATLPRTGMSDIELVFIVLLSAGVAFVSIRPKKQV